MVPQFSQQQIKCVLYFMMVMKIVLLTVVIYRQTLDYDITIHWMETMQVTLTLELSLIKIILKLTNTFWHGIVVTYFTMTPMYFFFFFIYFTIKNL